MTLICMKMKLHAELIFIWKVSHVDKFWTEAQENSEMAFSTLALHVKLEQFLRQTATAVIFQALYSTCRGRGSKKFASSRLKWNSWSPWQDKVIAYNNFDVLGSLQLNFVQSRRCHPTPRAGGTVKQHLVLSSQQVFPYEEISLHSDGRKLPRFSTCGKNTGRKLSFVTNSRVIQQRASL